MFGEANLLATVVVNLNAKGRQLGRGFATSHEYLLVYARDAAHCVLDATSASTVDPADFPLVTDDGRRFRHLPLRNTNKKFNPATAAHPALPGLRRPGDRRRPHDAVRGRRGGAGRSSATAARRSGAGRGPRIDERPDDLVCRAIAGRLGRAGRRLPARLAAPAIAGGRRKKLRTIWLAEEVGSTDTAVAELKAIVGHVFESPKPTGLLLPDPARRCRDDVVVLDFFAGSGTTGHAVALANAADGGTRRCLSVNSAEPTRPGSNAAVAGLADGRRHHPRAAARRRRADRRRARGARSRRCRWDRSGMEKRLRGTAF